MPEYDCKSLQHVPGRGDVTEKFALWAFLLFFAMSSMLASPAVSDDARAGGRGLPDIFPADEVEAGMRGVGYTSLRGEEPEEFGFEVLGVLHSFHPQGRIFLVELEHAMFDDSGVIAGMSGSPLYIDGQLLGAVAYGFTNSIKPIAGVTPAGEMQVPFGMGPAERDEPPGAGGAKARARDALSARVRRIAEEHRENLLSSEAAKYKLLESFVAAHWHSAGEFRDGVSIEGFRGAPAEPARDMPDARLRPLPVPLTFSGVEIGRLDALASVMRSGGLMAVQGPRTNLPPPEEDDMEALLTPGRPIGVVLMSGDIDIASMGTLTFSDGEKVAAFGHPMTGAGDTDLPLALGHVETVVPSRFMSFRLTSSRRIIGSVIQDRQSAIVGKLGRQAPMFPATVNVTGAHDATYRYELAGHWQFAPVVALNAAALSALRWEGTDEEMTVHATSRITLKGVDEPLVLQNIYAGFDPLRPAFELVMVPVQSLMLNPFEHVEIESLEVDFHVEKGIKAAAIEAVRVERSEVRPGEEVRMWVTLRRFHGPAHVEEISLQIPEDAEPGRVVRIRLSDAAGMLSSFIDRDPGLFRPRSLEGLMESLQVMPDNTRLYVTGDVVRKGLRYDQEPMPGLPGSVRNMLEFGTVRGKTAPLMEGVTHSVETEWVLEGEGAVQVKIIP